MISEPGLGYGSKNSEDRTGNRESEKDSSSPHLYSKFKTGFE